MRDSIRASADAWPMWGASVWCEVFVGGKLTHAMTLKFLRAPDADNASRGAIKMLREDYPTGSDFEAVVAKVPSHSPEQG